MIKRIGGWRLVFGLQAVLLAAGLLWLFAGGRDLESNTFLNKITSLEKAEVVRLTAEAQAASEVCGFSYNNVTDQMAYKAAALRRSHLAKKPELQAAYSEGYALRPNGNSPESKDQFCRSAWENFGTEGIQIPGLLSS